MKAWIKKSHIEVNVKPFYENRKFVGYSDEENPGHLTYLDSDLEFEPPTISLKEEEITNWQTLRNQAAIAAMQGLCFNEEFEHYYPSVVAARAVQYADALIAELKKK